MTRRANPKTKHTKTKLRIVVTPDPNASILTFAPGKGLAGDANEDLVCGSCGTVLGTGVSEEMIAKLFATPAQLLIRCCSCGQHNRLPAQAGN